MEFNKLIDEFKDKVFQDMYCSLVCKVIKVHDTDKIDVKPLYTLDGVSLPIIVQVPLMFIGNDTNIISVETTVGDYVLLVISDYDIDNLIIDGKDTEVNTNSKHQINDALALPFSFTPFNSQKAHTSKITLRSNGDIDIESSGNTNIVASSDVTLDAQGDVILDSVGTIRLGAGATEGLTLGDSLKAWLDGHTHSFSAGYSWTDSGGSGTVSGTTSSPGSSSPEPSGKVFTE